MSRKSKFVKNRTKIACSSHEVLSTFYCCRRKYITIKTLSSNEKVLSCKDGRGGIIITKRFYHINSTKENELLRFHGNSICIYIYIYIYICIYIYIYIPPMPPHVLCGLRGPPSWAWQECNRLLRLGRP